MCFALHVVVTTVCATECVHTSSRPHAQFSATVCRTGHPDTLLTRVHTRTAQGCEKGMCSAQVVTLRLAFSLLMFHPFAPLLSDNLCDTARQSLMFTELLLGLSRHKSAGLVHFRNSEDEFGDMANLPHSTGHEPNQPDRWFLRMMTRRPSKIQTTTVSVTSQKHTRTLDGSVFLQCVTVHTQPNTVESGDCNLLKKKENGNRSVKAEEEGLCKQKQENESSH